MSPSKRLQGNGPALANIQRSAQDLSQASHERLPLLAVSDKASVATGMRSPRHRQQQSQIMDSERSSQRKLSQVASVKKVLIDANSFRIS